VARVSDDLRLSRRKGRLKDKPFFGHVFIEPVAEETGPGNPHEIPVDNLYVHLDDLRNHLGILPDGVLNAFEITGHGSMKTGASEERERIPPGAGKMGENI
jgi:hypothetical protein